MSGDHSAIASITATAPTAANGDSNGEAGDNSHEPVTPLREDISLHNGPPGSAGEPSYVLHDPAADSYFHIGHRELEMLSRWHQGDPAQIANIISSDSTFSVTADEVVAFEQDLRQGGLLRSSSAQIMATIEKAALNKPHITSRFVNGMLFKRIPLVHPQTFLDRTSFLAAPFFMPGLWKTLLLGFTIALYLIGRQWDVFIASLGNMVNLQGALAISVALVISKSAHELAHGYAARRYGADVPVMGVALIIFWPLLYTETSNAWTLPNRANRITIALAGVAVELALAMACFIAWPFIEPGPLRDAAGFAATTLIVLSLAFNANPLMRFDGYFVLSEATGIENMQPRGFALLKWHLRRLIPRVATPYPETVLTSVERRRLLTYGIASAFYRIVLFTGIVYGINYMLFPALALPFSGAIIMSSLVYPALREIATWFQLAYRSSGNAGVIRTAVVTLLLISPLFIPWASTVQVPLTIAAGQSHDSFASEPARVAAILTQEGATVTRGEALVRLDSPELRFKLSRARTRALTLDRSINRQLTAAAYHRDLKVATSELARLHSEIAGLEARLARLTITAQTGGIVTFLDNMLRSGVWVRDDRPILQIVTRDAPEIVGYAQERDMELISPRAEVSIWFEGRPAVALRGRVSTVFPRAITALDEQMMAVSAEGPLNVRPTREKLVPEMALYKVKFILDGAPATDLPLHKTRGYARIDTKPRNLIGRIVDRIVGLWRRELG